MVNRRTIEALIAPAPSTAQAERNAMQVSLFDIFEASDDGGEHGPQYVEVPRWSESSS
jgi:hypothetical protein